jgi:hypothetical protein
MMAAAAIIAAAGAAQAQPSSSRPAAPGPAPRLPAPTVAPQAPQVPTRVSAKALSDLCAQDRGVCLAYVLGTADAFASALTAAGRPQIFCVPRGTTNDQIAQAAVRYVRAHPEEGRNNGALVVLTGLKAGFPCGY